MDEVFGEINKIPIVDIWRALGGDDPNREGKVLCKFHAEATPSAQVGGNRNIYKCYACGKTLGAWNLVKELSGLDNKGIWDWFDKHFRIKRPPLEKKDKPKQKVMTLDEAKDDLFLWQAALESNDEAIALLKSYGIRLETAQAAGLGLFPHPSLGLGLVYPIPDGDNPVAFKFRTLGRGESGKRKNQVLAGEITALYGQGAIKFVEPVCLTAGEEKWLLLQQEGRCAVSWATGENSRNGLLLKAITEKNPPSITICYDADDAGRKGTAATANTLRGMGYKGKIKTIDWDEGLPKGYDVNDAFRDGKLESLLNAAVDVNEADAPADIFTGVRGGLNPAKAVEVLLEKFPHLINVEGTWHNYADGIYKPLFDEEVKGIINTLMGDKASAKKIAEVYDLLKIKPDLLKRRTIWDGEERKMCLANGYLTINGKPELHPHSPDVHLRYKTDITYDPAAACPKFQKLLNDIFPDKAIHRLIQQWFGYCKAGEDPRTQQVAMLWIGEGANGKGILSHILSNIVGAEQVGHLRMSQLNKDFLVGQLYGKNLNIASESKGQAHLNIDEIVKQFIHADAAIQADEKYKSPFAFMPKAKWVFCLNDPLLSGDSSRGYWRSFIAVPFKVTFYDAAREEVPKGGKLMDKGLYDSILDELGGVLNWAIDGYYDLKKNGFVVPPVCRQFLEQMKVESNSVMLFVRDECKFMPQFTCRKKDLYKHYIEYCKMHGHYSKAYTTFGRELMRAYEKSGRIGEGRNDRGVVFFGISHYEDIDAVDLMECNRMERAAGETPNISEEEVQRIFDDELPY